MRREPTTRYLVAAIILTALGLAGFAWMVWAMVTLG